MLSPRIIKAAAIGCVTVGLLGITANSQTAPPAGPAAPQGGLEDFNTAIKGMEPLPGLVTLYQQNPADPNRDPNKLLAMIPRARAAGAFVGLIAGMSVVGAVNFGAPSVAFLWHNVIGAVTVVIVGMIISAVSRPGVEPRNRA